MSSQLENDGTEGESEAELPAHIGTDVGFAGAPEKKKDTHMQEAEKIITTTNQIPSALVQVLALPLKRNPTLRKKDKHINFGRPFPMEGYMLQARAEVKHPGKDACGYCQKGNGFFTECISSAKIRNGMCGNCLASGEGSKNCSFVSGLDKKIKKLETRRSLYKTAASLFGSLQITFEGFAALEASDTDESDRE
ncbi:MAG: hypothetical protein Q9204_005569 [Flavoplaca sp. TL-2023a]